MANQQETHAYYYEDALGKVFGERVLATSPIAYWKLNEESGTDIVDSSGNGYDGTYDGVVLTEDVSPYDEFAPLFDGTNDYGDMYSAGFAGALDLDEFTVMLRLRASAASVWEDATVRTLLRFWRDANNFIQIRKANTNNNIAFLRTGNGTAKNTSETSAPLFGDAEWVSVAISASVSGGGLLTAGDLRAYADGVQVGSTVTGNVAAAGSGLNTNAVTIGALDKVPNQVWSGYLSHCIVWDSPMDASKLALMT